MTLARAQARSAADAPVTLGPTWPPSRMIAVSHFCDGPTSAARRSPGREQTRPGLQQPEKSAGAGRQPCARGFLAKGIERDTVTKPSGRSRCPAGWFLELVGAQGVGG